MKRRMDARNLSGYFIFRDDKDRTYYSFPGSKDGYLIANSDAYTYYLYQTRPLIALVIALLSYVAKPEYFRYGVIAGLVFYAISTVVFYFAFLKKLPLIKDLGKPEREGYLQQQAQTDTWKLMAMCLMCLAVTALMIFILINKKDLTFLQEALIGIIVFAYGVYGLTRLAALVWKISHR